MSDKIKIAIDAMGGDDSPQKILDGIEIALKKNNNNFFYLYGDKDKISKSISNNGLLKKIVKLLILKIQFWMMKVHLLQ